MTNQHQTWSKCMSSIMDLIRPELFELSALDLENFSIFDFVYTLASANIDQSVPKLVTVYIAIKSRMSSIIGQIELENPELFALEFGKIAETDFVYSPASTNIDQSASNLVKMYMTIRSRMSSIMDLIRPELFELSTLELEIFSIFDFVYTLASANIDQSVPNLATIYMPIKSRMSLGQIESEHPELFALEFGKIAESDFVYTLSPTNIEKINTKLGQNECDHKTLDEFTMDLVGPELFELFALEFENLPYLTLFTL